MTNISTIAPSTTTAGLGPIGVFDSGYGGLTILKNLRSRLPGYHYLYLGDNARAPYGNRSFDVVYTFTLQAVKALFERGCSLVILACNTASAKALRSIQQNDLPYIDPSRRVLGVIRPTIETVPALTHTNHVGIFGTPGTIASHSYKLELEKFSPQITLTELACPMWVPLVENREASSPGADYFVEKYCNELMSRDSQIDTVVLGCTHYPLLMPKIRKYMPQNVNIIAQGALVADSLADYLKRHPEIDSRCMKSPQGACDFLTTENPEKFNELASLFLSSPVRAERTSFSS
jgi:glutamate racemase